MLRVSLSAQLRPGPTRRVPAVASAVLLRGVLLPKALPAAGLRGLGALLGGCFLGVWGTLSPGARDSFSLQGLPGVVDCWEHNLWIESVWLHKGDTLVRPEGNIFTFS